MVSPFNEIKKWMTANLLKLNGDKTELLVAVHKRFKNSINVSHIDIDSVLIKPSQSIRNLGAFFNITMDHTDFVMQKCRSARFALRNISRVRSSLTRKACETLVQAYVTSRLDYCNVLLYGLPKYLLDRLQKVQNSAARVVALSPKREHITPVLADLHWLPVEYRIHFKILLYTYKALNNCAPQYISELIRQYTPSRPLRSGNKDLLEVPDTGTTKYKHYGDRSFMSAAPSL